MIGLLTALASFMFLFISGYPLACLFLREGRRGLRLVLSPLLGLCLDAILLYVLGFYGNLPTRASAVILLAVILTLNVLAAVRDRTYFRIRGAEAGPLLASLVYLLVLAAPFFIVGRSYMSIWNEDFYGYVAVADYLKDHTVNERLDPELVREHPVYERVDTIVRVHFQGGFYRIGPEYQLSFVSVVLKGEVRELFFPVLISFAMLTPRSASFPFSASIISGSSPSCSLKPRGCPSFSCAFGPWIAPSGRFGGRRTSAWGRRP